MGLNIRHKSIHNCLRTTSRNRPTTQVTRHREHEPHTRRRQRSQTTRGVGSNSTQQRTRPSTRKQPRTSGPRDLGHRTNKARGRSGTSGVQNLTRYPALRAQTQCNHRIGGFKQRQEQITPTRTVNTQFGSRPIQTVPRHRGRLTLKRMRVGGFRQKQINTSGRQIKSSKERRSNSKRMNSRTYIVHNTISQTQVRSARPTADGRLSLIHDHPQTSPSSSHSSRQTIRARTDDNNVRTLAAHGAQYPTATAAPPATRHCRTHTPNG